MIHFTCDRCHRRIDTETEVRYSVDVHAQAVFQPQVPACGEDEDSDHLMELHEILERLDDEEGAAPGAEDSHHHFDLCADCYKIYLRNPIARDISLSIEFSDN